MKLVKKILNKLNGLHFSQEYVCTDLDSFHQPLNVYITENDKVVKDITLSYLFVGYCPLVFALYSEKASEKYIASNIQIRFTPQTHHTNDILDEKDAIAWLSLKLIRHQKTGSRSVFYYEGSEGGHKFLSSFHQFIINMHNSLFNKKEGNVFLQGNLYTQVQVAYSFPRIISLITASDGQLFNLFPTDLHGAVNNEYYIISLRHAGKACQQVEAARKILISQIHYSQYRLVYELGKNHTRELKTRESFPFSELTSANFKLPVPKYALNCYELELIETFTHQIHKILLFKIIAQQKINGKTGTLAHV